MYPQSRDARSGEVELVLNLEGMRYNSVTGNFRLTKSPCCGHDNPKNPPFSINKDNGLWTCFFGNCERSGNWVQFCKMVGHDIGSDVWEKPDVVNYDPKWSDHFANINRSPVSSNKYPEILDYCLGRGISTATLDAFRISNKWGQGIQVPLFCWANDTWERVNARNILFNNTNPNAPSQFFDIKGGPTHLLMGNNLLDINSPDKRAIIVEGQWDMMAGYEIGLRNIFSLPNGANNVKCAAMFQYIPHDWDIYVATDMDDAGHACAEKIFKQIGPEKFVRLNLPYKDLNDWLLADPDLTPEQVLATAKGRPIQEKKEIYESLDFTELCGEDDKPFVDTPWASMNKYLQGGFRLGELTCILAASGSGKTCIVNQIALHACVAGVKVGLISFEGTKAQLIRRVNACALSMENGIELGSMNLELTQMDGKRTTFEKMIVGVDRMIQNGNQLIIVDNLNSLDGEIKPQLNAFRQVVNMAVSSNVHLIMVTQPVKVGMREVITSASQKGFSSVYQDTSNHINMNYNPEDSNLRVIHVEKCRAENPGINACFDVQFNKKSGIYLETENTKTKNKTTKGHIEKYNL